MTNESMQRSWDVSGTQLRVVIEDDERVAYAYLMDSNGSIVGDVWLYNVAETPQKPEWTDRAKMPFLNPREFCNTETVPRVTSESKVSCVAHEDYVDIEVDGVLVARLKVGAKPGWSRLASKDGPLALRLSSL